MVRSSRRPALVASSLLIVATLAASVGAPRAASLEPGGAASVAAERVSTAMETRRQLGFRSDQDYVRKLEADASANRRWGAAMTANEVREVERRVRLQQSLAGLNRYLANQPNFAGMYIDQTAGATIDIAVTQDSATFRRGAGLSAPADATLRFRTVANTWRQLEAAKHAIDSSLRARNPGARGIVSVAIDVRRNTVKVGIDPSQVQAEAIATRFGRDVVEVGPAEPVELTACTGWSNCAEKPWRGGLGIRRVGSAYFSDCTSGFVVRQSNGGAGRWLLTAGHCGDKFQTWEHSNGVDMGQITADTFVAGSGSDAATIDINDGWGGNVILIDNVINRSITSGQALNTDNYGDYTCHNGVTTHSEVGGFVCGPLEWKDLTRCYTELGGGCIFHLRRVIVRVDGGDSGGSVFAGNQALGIVHAGSDLVPAGTHYKYMYYTHIARVIDDIGGVNNTVVLQTAP
jgi:hypothetical protein